jgi:chitinase
VNGPSVSFQVGATSTPEPPPASATQYWSIAFYPGWVQNRIPASAIDYSPWTHIFHFGMYPGSRGEVLLADMQCTAYPPDAVARAHAAGKKIVLVIGGESTGPAFTTATSSTYRATFVKNIVATMQRYGYDGVDVDWEEGVIDAQLVALMQELRTTLNALGTAPLLTIEVISGLVAPATAAKVSGLVDAVNVMSYWSSGLDQFTAFHDAGVPASKIVLGIGLASVYRDTTQALVQAKVDLARQYGMRGVDGWQLGDLTGSTDPRLVPLRNLVASNPK